MFNKVSRILKLFLWKIDVFGSSQLLRYKKQTNYSTLTGGVLSFIIIVIFLAILVQKSSAVLTQSSVQAQDFTYYVDNPTYTSFSFDESTNFIIGVGITGLNLSSTHRYFDVTMFTQVFSYGSLVSKTYHHLLPCEQSQWAHINEIGASSYHSAGLSGFLCPNKNLTVELEGKYTSDSFKLLVLKVGKCNNSTDPSRPCVDDSLINTTATYNLNFYFMNPFVNSGALDPVSYYLEDRNYFVYNTQQTVDCNLYMTQNVISTDDSLFPWENIKNQTVLLVKQLAEVKPSSLVPDQYLSIHLRKSPYFILSQRSFTKLQDLFSTIGGLFGFAVTFFLFIQSYTQASFQIQMGDRLFYYSQKKPLKSGSFNFFYFIFYCFYEFLRNINIEIPWERFKTYYECREEVVEQLDLSLLMNKITFLEKCMNIIFEEHQFRAIYLQQKPNVKEAEVLRTNHGLNKIIHKNSKKINDKIQNKVKQHNEKFNKWKSSRLEKKISRTTDLNIRIKDPSIENEIKPQTQKEEKNQYDLMQVIANFILKEPGSKESANSGQKQLQINVISENDDQDIQTIEGRSANIELEDVAGENHQSLKFLNTALKDIQLIEKQSRSGNHLSQRIYNQLNNDITKEQLIILKCLEFIVSHKSQEKEEKGKNENEIQKRSLFENLINLTKPAKETDCEKEAGLQIVLQSNNRIVTESDL